ncbi:MAG: hypothetical protein BWY21_02211 [Parcubacteria group bacterium ADurb.Bin216]|nr:MAG: hypothetical protein BWY21_02211 [Parcubacteria group bacterium ADurb.Bin216]
MKYIIFTLILIGIQLNNSRLQSNLRSDFDAQIVALSEDIEKWKRDSTLSHHSIQSTTKAIVEEVEAATPTEEIEDEENNYYFDDYVEETEDNSVQEEEGEE